MYVKDKPLHKLDSFTTGAYVNKCVKEFCAHTANSSEDIDKIIAGYVYKKLE